MTPFQMVAFCLCTASFCFLAMLLAMRMAYKPESKESHDCPQIPLGSLVRHRDGFFAQARVIDYSGPNWANPDMFDSCRKTVLDICSYLKKYQMKEVFDKCKWLFSQFSVEETYSETKQVELTGS